MLTRRLERRGYAVRTAEDGLAAVAAVREERPELMLLDLSLPGMDGWTVARTLRDEAEFADLPIIALTAHAMAGQRERAIEAGCDDYATKPVEFAALIEAIEALLARGDG
ncbi:MAG: response regulator [Myxococcota bacterium]